MDAGRIAFLKSEVFSRESQQEKLVSKAMVTLMAVPQSDLKRS